MSGLVQYDSCLNIAYLLRFSVTHGLKYCGEICFISISYGRTKIYKPVRTGVLGSQCIKEFLNTGLSTNTDCRTIREGGQQPYLWRRGTYPCPVRMDMLYPYPPLEIDIICLRSCSHLRVDISLSNNRVTRHFRSLF